VVKLTTKEGFSLRLTDDHQVRKITRLDRYNLETEWCAAGQLNSGDQVLLNNHRHILSGKANTVIIKAI